MHSALFLIPICLVLFFVVRAVLQPQVPSTAPPPAGPEGLGAMTNAHMNQSNLSGPNFAAVDHGAPVPPDSGPCTVRVTANGPNKIQAIKLYRAVRLNFSLLLAKNFADNVPQVLFHDLPAADAERVRLYLTLGGVSVVVEPNRTPASSLAADGFHVQPTAVQPNASSPVHNQLDELERLERMKQNGILTDAEFTRMKAEILGTSGNPFQT